MNNYPYYPAQLVPIGVKELYSGKTISCVNQVGVNIEIYTECGDRLDYELDQVVYCLVE